MIVVILVILGIVSLFLKGAGRRAVRRRILIGGAIAHNVATAATFLFPAYLSIPPYFSVDAVGSLFLALTSFIFTLVAFYSLGYLPLKRPEDKSESGGHIYVSCMLFFLAAMTLAISTAHVGILWISIEATTLSSAPLIYYSQNQRSLEAAWKYLLICSVGIAIALLGIFFVAASSSGTATDLSVASLVKNGAALDKNLLRIGFLLILTGFGTKMGLAPLHSWLPDAHSEAPSPVSALLSGTLLNCALLGILRFYQICDASGLHDFVSHLLKIFGLFSICVAAIFVTSQKDYKRLFAYSSIENMGIIALGIAVGANFASMLHVVAHSLTKVLLFFVAGNVFILYRTKKVSEVNGLIRTSPVNGVLLLVGGFAILGLPPFLPFISEFLILKKGIANGDFFSMALYLFFLGIIFVSMSRIVLKMAHGKQKEQIHGAMPNLLLVPPAVLAVAVVAFGIYLPDAIAAIIDAAGNIL